MRLRDKVIVATGGSRGIGRSCSIRCAEAGAKVVVNYARNAGAAQDTLAAIREAGHDAIAVQADVSKRSDVKRLLSEAIGQYGRVTGLINNAGVAPFVDFMEINEATWDNTFEANVKALYLTTQAAAMEMIQAGHGGRICNITSISGLKATDPLQVPYCSFKGAANMFTKIAALALARYNITVNAILPGTIETDLNREVLSTDGVRERIESSTPLRCLGQVDDIGHAAVYFMSDESRWVTGTLLPIDGGFII